MAVPDDIDRIDVAGGTLPGWSALITLLGATRLYSGGHLTVLDLSEGAIAKDLIELARKGGDEPLVWVLPVDLPRLDLGATLKPEAFADVLAHVVSVSEEHRSTRDLASTTPSWSGCWRCSARTPRSARSPPRLRALAQVGDPRDDLRFGLITATQLERIGTLFGRGRQRPRGDRAGLGAGVAAAQAGDPRHPGRTPAARQAAGRHAWTGRPACSATGSSARTSPPR